MNKKFIVSAIVVSVMLCLNLNVYADKSDNIERIGGVDRYNTGVELSKKIYSKSKKAIIVSGEDYPDALSGGNISMTENIPLFMTQKDKLNKEVFNELKRLNVNEVVIVGGKNSVSDSVEDNLNKNFSVSRIYGKDREETSLEVYRRISRNRNIETVGVSNGHKFSDSLAAIPYLNQENGILILSNGENISNKLEFVLDNKKVILFGGENSISNKFKRKIKSTRISGNDRYETAEKIGEEFCKNNGKTLENMRYLIITSGINYPDALSSIPLSLNKSCPIIFSSPDSIKKIGFTKYGRKIFIVGGENSVNKSIENKLKINEISDENKNTSSKSNNVSKSSKEEYIDIPDKLFLKVLNKNIDPKRSDNQKISKNDMLKLKQLSVYGPNTVDITNIKPNQKREEIIPMKKIDSKWMVSRGMKSIEGIQYAKNLEAIEISECEIENIKPLKNLKKLRYIEIDRNRIKDINALSGLTELNHLKLYNNLITDITPLSKLKKLKYLDIHYNVDNNGKNGISDISSLKNLKSLEFLDVSANHLKNIDVLNEMPNLKMVDFSNNNIDDYTKIQNKIIEISQIGYGNCGFFGQNYDINKKYEIPPEGGEIVIKNPSKGLKKIAMEMYEIPTFFTEFDAKIKNSLNSGNTDVFENERIIKSIIKSISYDEYKDQFIINILPNNTDEDRNQELGFTGKTEEYAWNFLGIKINQKHISDKTEIKMDMETKKFYVDLLNKYNKTEKKYVNLTDEASIDYKKIDYNTKITKGDMKKLRVFTVVDRDVNDKLVDPLKYATNLEEFQCMLNNKELKRELKNFDFLSSCKKLKKLYYINQDYKELNKSGAVDLSSLGNNKDLEDFRMNATNTSDISGIKDLKLKNLSLEENNIYSVFNIIGIDTLERLDLENNKISNLNGFENLKNLRTLYVYGNNITTLKPLYNLNELEALLAEDNKIKNIDGIENLNLYRLRLQGNPLENNYMDSIKKMKNINHLCVGKINTEDFNWLQYNLIRPENKIVSDLEENNPREEFFENLDLEYEVTKDEIKENKIIIVDNKLKYADGKYISIGKNKNVNFKNDKIEIDISNITISENNNIVKFALNYDEENNEYQYNNGYYGQPSHIEGKINLIIKLK
ncbi:hypothetical protein HLB30_05215 [Peptostreptococcus russellii]|uniref:cell wall-binding repeat-containing protein n=1 Tax=Peptostreptococcus russellii TaxID=215200 RepID=UPI001624098B|nr:cell wall-binding repeat-containing protein [Peptostreptococcus russellii]MBC2577916.1 hypothetical protein [Peptostreptococcus russellii]